MNNQSSAVSWQLHRPSPLNTLSYNVDSQPICSSLDGGSSEILQVIDLLLLIFTENFRATTKLFTTRLFISSRALPDWQLLFEGQLIITTTSLWETKKQVSVRNCLVMSI